MKDVDRRKIFNSKKEATTTRSPDPSPDHKELLELQSELEKATGKDRERIEKIIRSIADKKKQ